MSADGTQRKCNGKAGVCGKKSDTAKAQDELIGALIGLAKAAECGTPTNSTERLVLKGLFTTITNVSFNTKTVNELTAEVEEEKRKFARARLTTMTFQGYGKQAMIFAR